MRDHTRLRVFHLADELAVRVYECSRTFPTTERFGLTSQARRAAVSVAANIVEGCARFSEAEYVRFLEMAYGSARELQYEISLCTRLGYLDGEAGNDLNLKCTETAKSLGALLKSLRRGR
jgi:four helix bundle protein